MKLIKKIFIVLLILSLQFGNLGGVLVYAQEATPSATLAPSPSPTPIQSEPTVEPSATPTASPASNGTSNVPATFDSGTASPVPTSSPAPVMIPEDIEIQQESVATASALNSLTSPEPVTSARIKPPVVVHRLSKKNFRADEKITIVVGNATTTEIKITLLDNRGEEITVGVEELSDSDPAAVRLVPPPSFKPGKYTLQISDESGKVLSTQDFTWGVLAINTNKSIYAPFEEANLAMAVLDETGMMVCDAKVELRIKNQELNIDEVLSTENGKIKVNPECKIKNFTLKPDYEASYKVKEAGVYKMELSARTKSTFSITDAFEVRDKVPFDVERIGPTRIYPPEIYPVTLKIKANEDFKGTVKEIVPSDFGISQQDGVMQYETVDEYSQGKSETEILGASIFGLGMPVKGEYDISLGFGGQHKDPLLSKKYTDFGVIGHDGLDFPMPSGTSVLAVDEGEVVRAKAKDDYGTTIVIQHSWGKSYYGHLSKLLVAEGQIVTKGQEIALSGSTGLSSAPHLHLGIKPNKNDFDNGYFGKINPAPFLALSPQTNQSVLGTSTDKSLDKVKVIRWNIDIKKGDELLLGYRFKAPNVSPQFYLLGPADFKDGTGKLVFQEARLWQIAADATATVFITSGTTWVVPNDWSNVNTIEVIGGGGGGCGHVLSAGSGGGGGGAYSKISNLTLTKGATVNIAVGAAGAFRSDGGDTWFNGTTCAGASVCADAGLGSINAAGVAGGQTANGVGTLKYKGGTGGTGDTAGDTGGGGGGAGGPNGDGGAGGFGDNDGALDGVGGGGGGNGGRTTTGGYVGGDGRVSDTVGADGGNNFSNTASSGGTGGSPGEAGVDGGGGGGGSDNQSGGNGGNGIDWDSTHGSGGGGGGGGDASDTALAGKGGLYGGGGGGGGQDVGHNPGAQGIIVVTYTINTAPSAPSQDSPANAATGVSLTPTFTMTTTDPDSDKLSYKVTIYSNSACTTVVQTNDQAVSSTGWTGSNATCTASPTACYTSGTQGSFLTQTSLTASTQYWWKASAKDPDNTSTFTDSSTCNTFTTTSAGPTNDQLMRHGAWFDSGVEQPFTF